MDSRREGAEIVLHRSKTYRDRLRKYKVLVDGELRGYVSASEEKSFPVLPGEHKIQLKVDWKGSPVLQVTVSPGDKMPFACGGKRGSLAIVDLFRRSEDWIPLEALDEE